MFRSLWLHRVIQRYDKICWDTISGVLIKLEQEACRCSFERARQAVAEDCIAAICCDDTKRCEHHRHGIAWYYVSNTVNVFQSLCACCVFFNLTSTKNCAQSPYNALDAGTCASGGLGQWGRPETFTLARNVHVNQWDMMCHVLYVSFIWKSKKIVFEFNLTSSFFTGVVQIELQKRT